MSLRPFFPFYGGKWRAALGYPAPQHQRIIEPFAGSAGYSTRHWWASVVLVERDPVIASVWRLLLTAAPGDIIALPDVGPDQDLRELDVPPAARALMGFWVNPANAYPANKPSRWFTEWPNRVWRRSIRERIADQMLAIRHWTLIEGDWSEGPHGPATRFVDPPYVVAGHHYRHGPKGVDYDELSAACQSWEGQTIVCEAEGASWLPFEPHGTPRSYRGKSKEMVWTNDASLLAVVK